MKPERGVGYLPTLDGWRAFAIVAVMVYHGTTSLFYPFGPYPSYEALRVVQIGARGVDVFFAISGFLICSRLLAEQEKNGRISLLSFYIRRSFRILPPYFVYLGILAVLAMLGILAVERREFVGSALFIRNYYGPTVEHGWYTGHFWSLAVEEHFYLIWPILLVLCGSRRARPVAAVLAFLVPVWQIVNQEWNLLEAGHPSQRTDTRIDALLWGCWVALVINIPLYRAWITRWLTTWSWAAIVCAVMLLIRFGPFSEEQTVTRHVEAFLMPWLLVGTVLHPHWRVSRFLEIGVLCWIGRLSYSLYIWQQIWLLGSWKEVRPFPLGPLQELPLNLLCTFGCAVLSYHLVERPTLRLGMRLSKFLTGSWPGASTPVRLEPQVQRQ